MKCPTAGKAGVFIVMGHAKQYVPLEPITVRFPPKVMKALDEAARENGMSKAQVVRLATDGSLSKYLRDVKIIMPSDAAAIRAEIQKLLEEVRKVDFELHRIGVLLDQIAKALNTMAKNGQTNLDRIEGVRITKEDLGNAIWRFEAATGRVGELLNRLFVN